MDNYENFYQQTVLSKSIQAGLFAGILSTIVCLAYDFIFRSITFFSLSPAMINVATIIFGSLLILLASGIIYYLLFTYLKKAGEFLYMALFIILTLICVNAALHFQRSADAHSSLQFRELFIGIIIITGLATFVVPFFTRHKTVF
ncbi:MAG: hypothetical protein KGL19_09500 [Bacteroidota bacterium]|nr:hypothetical protein [Bacteroidota bacterium]